MIEVVVVLGQTSTLTFQGNVTEAEIATNRSTSGTHAAVENVPFVIAAVGIFTKKLDLGADIFTTGASGVLEVPVSNGSSSEVFSFLISRQPPTSAPLAFKAVT